MGKKKAPKQPTTKADMGLFGSTTTGSFGSPFNPTDFQNQLLAPALSKGWLRGSTAQDVATVANQDYQNRRYDLVNQELNRQQQNLANNLANYLTMYDIAKGTTGLSNSLNSQIANFQLEAQKANQASADARYAANM